MHHTNQDRRGTAFTVSVDAREGMTTGISAAERARTIALLADPATRPTDLSRPGHVFPLRAKDGGVLRRPGHTEAAVDLVRMAGLRPAGALCEMVNDDGTMMRLPDLARFAAEHGARRSSPSPTSSRTGGGPRSRSSGWSRRGSRPSTARSGRSATAPTTTTASTSRWSPATSATVGTCWYGCTPSA